MIKRVVFAGTPAFSVPLLQALCAQQAFEVAWVYTQPDRPSGRGLKSQYSPVKRWCLERGVRCVQPEKLGKQEADALIHHNVDALVVAAYGQILPVCVLDAVNGCALNLHASLLPRWRGASPITAALLAGDAELGYSIMRMEKGLDTGCVYLQEKITNHHQNAGELADWIAKNGAQSMVDVLLRWQNLQGKGIAQAHALATYAPKIQKSDAKVHWGQTALQVVRHIQAYNPQPVAFCTWQGLRVKLHQARLSELPRAADAAPGTVQRVDEKGVHVACVDGVVLLESIQLPGKKIVLAAKHWQSSLPIRQGALLL